MSITRKHVSTRSFYAVQAHLIGFFVVYTPVSVRPNQKGFIVAWPVPWPCPNALLMHAIENTYRKDLTRLKTDLNRIPIALRLALGFILDATFRAIIDAIRDQFEGKLWTKIDARTIIEPGPV